ncbi:thioredoxin [Pseudomonas sp. NPDC012596]|uniref:thioredoxin n=1 Tax=Pseudomonas sp. NPDC012596 TaxID=3364419 RepID=UPI0036CB13FD
MAALDNVTDATFEEKVFQAGRPVLVDFYAAWCGPCKGMVPALEDLAREYTGEVDILVLDIDANRETAARYNVRGLPTFILFKGEQVLEQVLGSTSRSRLAASIEAALEQV